MKGNIFYIFLIFIFEKIKSGIVREINKNFLESKYSNYQYIAGYRIPNSIMSFNGKNGLASRELSNAFDENFNTYWQSTSFQKANSGFMNDVQVTFTKTVTIDRILYQAPIISDVLGKGYPIELKVYIKLRRYDGSLSKEDSDYLLVDDFISERTEKKVLFIFNEKIACDQIKLQWARIEEIIKDKGEQACASEIIFLFPENKYINKTIYNLFSDYYKINIFPEYNNIIKIEDLEQNMIDYLDILPQIQYILNRAKKVINGKLKYESRREFTTRQTVYKNRINQYGHVANYSRNILLMSRGGTNRQPTGIYAFSKDILTIFVDSEYNDPLPSIRFSQYIGLSSNWLSSPFQLKRGINHLNVSEFNINNIEVKVKKGGPIYIENPFLPRQQSQNVKLYFDDGILFPLFRINDYEKNFKYILSNYIIDYKKNINTYYNIMELYSDRLIITWNATDAYKVYIEEGESPQENLKYWDNSIKKLYIFEGIQFEKNQPYYNIKNDYITIHMRYSTYLKQTAAAYASEEHIGIFLHYNFY